MPSPTSFLPLMFVRHRKNISRIFSTLLILFLVGAPTILHNYYGFGISPVLTGSMRPFTQPGDAFITINRTASELKVGEVVTLHSADSDSFYAHRIVDIREQNGLRRIITKGDANTVAEANPYMVSPITEVPVALYRVKWIGSVLVYLTSIQGRQAGLAFLVIANVLALVLSLFKKPTKKVLSRSERVIRELYAEMSAKEKLENAKKEIYQGLYKEAHAQLRTIKEN